MNVFEAVAEVTYCKQRVALLTTVIEMLQAFRQVEGDERETKVIWMEEGGRVPETEITVFIEELQREIGQCQTKMETLLNQEVSPVP